MIFVAVGVPGSGKSTGLQQLVIDSAARGPEGKIVPDYDHDWTARAMERKKLRFPPELAGKVVRVYTVAQAIEYIEQRGVRLAIFRADETKVSADWRSETARIANAEQISRWVMKKPGRGACFHEAHLIWRNNYPLSGDLDRLITAWRHAGPEENDGEIDVWLDSQRLAMLHTTVTSCATEVRMHALSGEADLRRVREIGGRELEEQIKICARYLAEEKVKGEGAGYFVRLKYHRLPPYEIEREEIRK